MPRDCVPLLLVVLWLLPVAGCNRPPAPAAGGAAPAAPQVTVVKPEQRPVRREVEQPGTVLAFEETVLHAKIPGFVGSIAADPDKNDRPEYDRLIDIGSRVRKDQVLAELAVPELGEELKQKEALVRQAEAEITQAKKSLAAAEAAVGSAEAAATEAAAGVTKVSAEVERWKTELAQADELVSRRVASARAAVRKAEADKEKAAADVDAAAARKAVAEAEVARVRALLGYTHIKAPFDGVVTRRSVSTGDFVAGVEKAGLFTVARTDPVRVVVSVPEADAGLVSVGQEVRVALQAVPGQGLTGTVTRTSWSLDPGSRTLRTEIDLPNPDGKVRPGMYVYAKLTAELPAAWAVPAAAVGKAGDEPVVYLVENGKAVRVAVQVLRGDGKFTQVRRYKKPGASDWADFTGGESVATPAAALTDGQAVQ
jgi:HlyD family secretion protein